MLQYQCKLAHCHYPPTTTGVQRNLLAPAQELVTRVKVYMEDDVLAALVQDTFRAFPRLQVGWAQRGGASLAILQRCPPPLTSMTAQLSVTVTLHPAGGSAGPGSGAAARTRGGGHCIHQAPRQVGRPLRETGRMHPGTRTPGITAACLVCPYPCRQQGLVQTHNHYCKSPPS